MPKIARDHLYQPRFKVGAIICNNGWLGDFFVSFACGASNVINKDVHFRTGTDGSEFTYTVDNRLVYYTLHMSKYCTNEKVFLDVNYVWTAVSVFSSSVVKRKRVNVTGSYVFFLLFNGDVKMWRNGKTGIKRIMILLCLAYYTV